MSWSYRKSFGSGPFRINVSKRGISYSVGIKGARLNIGPRGTYVNLSSHGITYRRKIQNAPLPMSNPVPYEHQPLKPLEIEIGHNIASAEINQLTDTDSKDFIRELTDKSNKVKLVNSLGVLPLIIFILILAFTTFSGKTIVRQPATDSTLVKITSPIGAYIRARANAKSQALGSANAGQIVILLDSTNDKWLKIAFKGTIGYVNRRFAEIARIHHDEVTETQITTVNPYAGYMLIVGLIAFFFWIRWLKKYDRKRFETELNYEMDEHFIKLYDQFANHFDAFSRSARIWQYLNTQHNYDLKRNAGAGNLIKRVALLAISRNKFPLPYFNTNVSIPYLKLTNLEFYFLPERLLVKQGKTFAALFYKNLKITSLSTRFIEEEGVAHDAKIVDSTWRYVNKNGEPDKRFNNNRQIPICLYSEYHIDSGTGIREVLTTSKQGAMDEFAAFLTEIGNLQAKMAIV